MRAGVGRSSTDGLESEAPLRGQRPSARERGIIGLICEGLTTRDTTTQLSRWDFTMGTHRRNKLRKLELHTVATLPQINRYYTL